MPEIVERECNRCGAWFQTLAGRGGRPRTRCDNCRTSHDKIAGKQWQAVRAAVLAGGPKCATPTCPNVATQVDHIIPLSKGGAPYDPQNLQPLCRRCNIAKKDRVEVKHQSADGFKQLPSGYLRGPDGQLYDAERRPRSREW